MKPELKYQKLQMHENLHENVNENMIHIFLQFFDEFLQRASKATGARIYENLLPCLMLRGLLFNSIQKFQENKTQ